MTDAEKAAAAIAELKLTTVGWSRVKSYSPAKLATTHWGKAMVLLNQIASATGVFPSKTVYPSETRP